MRVATCHRTSSWDMRCWGVRPAPDLSQRGKVILTVKCAPLPLAGRFTPPVPAAFHLFNPPGGGEAAAWQSTRCPDRYLVSFLQGERRLASNCTVSFLRIYTSFFAGWLTDINGRERISSLYIYIFHILSYLSQGSTSLNVLVWSQCARLLAERQRRTFTTSGSIAFMSGGGLLL